MGQPQSLRRRNRRQVLQTLLDCGALTRPQLAERTGLSKVTVNAIVQELQGCGLVHLETGVSFTSGRVPQAVQPKLATLLALDVQPDHYAAHALGLVGPEVQVWGGPGTPRSLTGRVAGVIREVCAQQPFGPLQVVLIGLPAPVDADGRVGEPNAVKHLNIAELHVLAAELGVKLAFENDANLVALAAQQHSPQFSHLAVLVERCSGTGLGLILGGELYRGGHGRAGELGRAPWPVNGGTEGVECLEDLPQTQRLQATAFALAGLTHALDLQHVVLGLTCQRAGELTDLLKPMLAPPVTLAIHEDVSRLALHGAGLLARQLARRDVLERAEVLSGGLSGGERHVA